MQCCSCSVFTVCVACIIIIIHIIIIIIIIMIIIIIIIPVATFTHGIYNYTPKQIMFPRYTVSQLFCTYN